MDGRRKVGRSAGGVGVVHLRREGNMKAHVSEENGYVWLVGHDHTERTPSAVLPLNPKIGDFPSLSRGRLLL